jgi:HTH-type transcriptional regulator/antitoxin HigA
MEIKPIKTEKITQSSCKTGSFLTRKKGSSEGDELEVLGILIDQYENEHFLCQIQLKQ